MNRLALQVVCVVGVVSTALAAPTSMLPPSEALSGHEELSNAPLHQLLHQLQPADGFPATAGLDVREPLEVTTIFLETSDNFSDKTRQPRSGALSSGEESSDVLLPQHFHADGFPAMGIDVHEPQAAGVLANSVTTSGEFFDKTWSLRDGADVHDHDQSTVTDTSYNTVDFKPLGRRAANEPKVPSPTPKEQAQLDVDTNYKFYLKHKTQADKLHDELAGIPSDQWGETENRRKISKAADNDRIALRHLKNAHSLGSHFSVGVKGEPGYRSELLPDLAQEQARVQNLKDTYENALRGYVPEASIKRAGDLQASSGKRRKTRGKNTESSGIPPDNLHVFPANTSGNS